MKVFVATSEGQGLRPGDFFNSREDDLVFFSAECGNDVYNIDGTCGCRRSMSDSEAGTTTTFRVADLNMSRDEYVEKYIEYLIKSGRFDPDEVEDGRQHHQEEAETLLQAAENFPAGEILEKRGDDIQSRPAFCFTLERNE